MGAAMAGVLMESAASDTSTTSTAAGRWAARRRSGGDRTGLAAGRGVERLEQSRAGVDADRRDAAFVVAEHGQALAVGEQPLHEPVVVAVQAQQAESLDGFGFGFLAEDEAR